MLAKETQALKVYKNKISDSGVKKFAIVCSDIFGGGISVDVLAEAYADFKWVKVGTAPSSPCATSSSLSLVQRSDGMTFCPAPVCGGGGHGGGCRATTRASFRWTR